MTKASWHNSLLLYKLDVYSPKYLQTGSSMAAISGFKLAVCRYESTYASRSQKPHIVITRSMYTPDNSKCEFPGDRLNFQL